MTLKHLSSESIGLHAMASRKKINAYNAIKKLEGACIIYLEDNMYHYYDPVFQYWVVKTIK